MPDPGALGLFAARAFVDSLAERPTLWDRTFRPEPPLLSGRSVDPIASVLEDRIGSCAPANRCLSAACTLCSRALQQGFIESAMPIFAVRPHHWVVASIVAGDLYVRKGELADGSIFRSTRERIDEVFGKRRDIRVIGGFDISLNEMAGSSSAAHWQPHVWALVRRPVDENALRAAFPATASVPRPVVLSVFDGRSNALAYAVKANFARRETTPATSVSRRNTRHRPLRVEERVELAIELHRSGLASRLYLRGTSFDRRTNRFRERPDDGSKVR